MIPIDFITEWEDKAPWAERFQVEQDLIISRALVEIYSNSFLASRLAFRGGTALHKLHLKRPSRYSEDIDFVQISSEPIGPTFDALRKVLDPWLGEPRRVIKEGLVKLIYSMRSEGEPAVPMKLKVEINSREHFGTDVLLKVPYFINSRWFKGNCEITTLKLSWLLGSKMRALYQRKKGRDLYDLWAALSEGMVSGESIAVSFIAHLKRSGQTISRAEFEKNLFYKEKDTVFTSDMRALLSRGKRDFDFQNAFTLINRELVPRLPGEAWRGEKESEQKKNPR